MTSPSCRFTPTCSQYAVEAIKKHGPFKGLYLAVKRILRCHRAGVAFHQDILRETAAFNPLYIGLCLLVYRLSLIHIFSVQSADRMAALQAADSVFALVAEQAPDSYLGDMWRARTHLSLIHILRRLSDSRLRN